MGVARERGHEGIHRTLFDGLEVNLLHGNLRCVPQAAGHGDSPE